MWDTLYLYLVICCTWHWRQSTASAPGTPEQSGTGGASSEWTLGGSWHRRAAGIGTAESPVPAGLQGSLPESRSAVMPWAMIGVSSYMDACTRLIQSVRLRQAYALASLPYGACLRAFWSAAACMLDPALQHTARTCSLGLACPPLNSGPALCCMSATTTTCAD